MRTRPLSRVSGLLLMLVAACELPGRGENRSDEENESESGSAKPNKKREKSAKSAKPAETAASVSSEVSAGATPTTSSPTLPPGRSALPTADEWSGVGEVTVKGSSSLGCETKMVREWLRISCRGKNDTGGTPTTLQVLRATPPEVFPGSFAEMTTLLIPYIEGTRVEAVFSWTNKSHKLVVEWPRGAPKPTAAGVFEGASSPLSAGGDAREAAFHKRACECEKQTHGTQACEMSWIYVEDCFRSYENDCANLLVCTTGHPDAAPKCPPGKHVAGYNRCVPN